MDWRIWLAAGGGLLLATLAFWLVAERGSLLLPSTLALIRATGWSKLFTNTFWEGYYAGRWTNRYVILLIRTLPNILDRVPFLWPLSRKWMSDRYHSKIVPHDEAKALLSIQKDIPLTDLEQVIPYPMARDLMLEASPDIVLYECACRARRENPCLPTMVCMVVGQPFADFVLEHNPNTSRRITQEQALEILHDEHERGHMHAAWFRKICMDRFYCLCNCCKCCCAGIEGMKRINTPMMTSSGYISEVDPDLCLGCGTCESICLFDARKVRARAGLSSGIVGAEPPGGQGETRERTRPRSNAAGKPQADRPAGWTGGQKPEDIPARALNGISVRDWDLCMGCGVCVDHCPSGATSLVLAPDKGIPLDVRLLQNVDGDDDPHAP